MLAGTDGSERALEAVRRGAELAAVADAPLHAVFVIDTHHAHDADVETRAERALSQAASAAADAGVEAQTRVLAGDPAETLMAEAATTGADLLAIGPDAGLLGGAIRIGRVAARLLRESPCSVLLGREAAAGFPRLIQCGVDGSESSVVTAAFAARIAAIAGAELRLQHVVPIFRGDNQEWTLEEAEPSPPELEPAVHAARAAGIEPVRAMAMGRPEHALVDTARRDGVDLVVVGYRGLSGVARALLGSVSEYVAQHAPCSVLVVRGQGV